MFVWFVLDEVRIEIPILITEVGVSSTVYHFSLQGNEEEEGKCYQHIYKSPLRVNLSISSLSFYFVHCRLSVLVPRLPRFVDQDQKSRPGFPLREWFDRTTILQEDDKFDLMTRGMTSQPSQAMDEFVTEDLTNFLFKHKNSFGLDLESLDIQRGRDHGLAPYNDFRELCGLPRANNFSDLTDHIDKQHVELLSQHYLHVDDVDLFVGGRLERLVPGTLAGITFQCIMGEQFFRWKFGDRWFYDFKENPASFTLGKYTARYQPWQWRVVHR
uniref:(California timema) hypothetical protein n=1 Tax=Timema californicum TaxID=61474 RepID=A0A7R9J7A8_TIMCA|nr:unnamed protein product [Timema californicum]